MTIGTGVFSPSASFAIPRALQPRVSVSGILGIPVKTANSWYFPHPVIPNEDYYLIWQPNFYAWNSKTWRLDEIVLEYYHVFTGDPTHYPVDYSLTWFSATTPQGADILNVPFAVSTTPNHFLLPPRTSAYWLPDL